MIVGRASVTRTYVEAFVDRFCRELLGVAVTSTSNFVAVGGDSLMAVILASNLSDDLGVEVSPGLLISSESIGAFVDAVMSEK
jgi:acyl carrier protein